MLALLARDAPEAATALLDRVPDVDWFPTDEVYQAVGGKLPEQILEWLHTRKSSEKAFCELSEFGDPQDRFLLEARLEDLRLQWRGHKADLEDAPEDSFSGFSGEV